MSSRWSRLEPKVSAVVRVATANTAAITVVRTGTAVRPRPPSSAWRAADDQRERAQGAAEEASHEGRWRRSDARWRRGHGAGPTPRGRRAGEQHAEEHREHADADHGDVHLDAG